jgi:hypothetical protein
MSKSTQRWGKSPISANLNSLCWSVLQLPKGPFWIISGLPTIRALMTRSAFAVTYLFGYYRRVLITHLNNREGLLLHQTTIPAIGGHSLHLGIPREAFVQDFLEDHLPSDLAIGSGEIIDRNSAPGAPRNQHDIVIYRNNFPRIYLGGGISAFLNEAVVATIEVKSTLDQDGVNQSVGAARAVKQLSPSRQGVFRPIASYVVAYAGPANMSTAFGWIRNAYADLALSDPQFEPAFGPRNLISSPALDGIFILGKGSCLFENNVGYLSGAGYYNNDPNMAWSVSSCEVGSLALFFAALLGLVSSDDLIPWPYFAAHPMPNPTFHRIDTPAPTASAANDAEPAALDS